MGNTKRPKNLHRIVEKYRPYIDETLKEALIKPFKGVSYSERFIDKFLQAALEDPNSAAGRALAAEFLGIEALNRFDAVKDSQAALDRDFVEYRIRKTLFDRQQELFDCKDPSVIVICTRRAGKTETNARLLVKDIINKGHHALYINRSFDAAVGQIGKPLLDTIEMLGIQYTGSIGGGFLQFPQFDSWIMIGGYNNKGQIDRYRGYRVSLVIIDEIGHLRNPKALIDECIEPAMLDYGKEARIIYSGTPPRTKVAYARELWDNPSLKHFKWSFMDNPYIPDKEDAIAKICEKHGVTVDSPFIQREYFGNMDAYDSEALIFHDYKMIDKLPDEVWSHAWIGVDWGYEDEAAVVSVVASHRLKRMYVVQSWTGNHRSISEIADEVKRQLKYLKSNLRLDREPWVITDTNEKSATYELYQTYKIPNVYCAYKYNKILAIEQLADWSRSGTLLIQKTDEAMKKDFDNALWKRDEDTDELLKEVDDEEYHGNAMYALLYVSRQFAFDIMGLDYSKTAKEILASGGSDESNQRV